MKNQVEFMVQLVRTTCWPTTNTCKSQLAGLGFHVLTPRQASFGPRLSIFTGRNYALFSRNRYLLQYFLSASTLYIHPHVSGTERVGFSKQDTRGNLVVKTPISVSGHETRFTAIPKLGKTWISVSGPEIRSNGLIFPFLPFAEGVCCERPLDVIIILTNGHMTVRFLFQVIIMCISLSSNWSNTFWTYKMY